MMFIPKNEPVHDKNLQKRLVRSAKTQNSLRIRAVWSRSSLIGCAFYSLWAIQNLKELEIVLVKHYAPTICLSL